MRSLIRAASRRFPREHPLHNLAIAVYDYSLLSRLAAVQRARGQPLAVFIHVPKTAGTSINVAFDIPVLNNLGLIRHRFVNRGLVTFGHMDYLALVRDGYVSRRFHERSRKFAFCRNPYDRAVSLYEYLRKIDKLDHGRSFLDFCRTLKQSPPIGLYNTMGLSQCNPQVRWLENIKLDFVGRYERIDLDLKRLGSFLALPPVETPFENRSARQPYRRYLCAESTALLNEYYREDFDAFGYATE